MVRFNRVATCEHEHGEFSGGEPVASVRHRGQANALLPRQPLQVLFGPALFLGGLSFSILSRDFLGLPFLLFEPSDAVGHGGEEGRHRLHHLPLVLRDVEVHGVHLSKSRADCSHHFALSSC